MDEATMERYADMLDELERTDPERYQQLMLAMKAQVEGAAMGQQDAIDPSLLDMLKGGAAPQPLGGDKEEFKPRFPGNKVMDSEGIKAKQEGIYIDVTPGFVMKTCEIASKKKVFVNVCQSSEIQTFSQRKKLDDEGKEQEGLHVPLSLGAPHEVLDKKGNASLAFDVAVNTEVVHDCLQDKTGSFRNFVCELAIEYIDQKYKIKLDSRYKLPKLSYSGDLPPPKHYIRKVQTPKIQEVTPSSASAKAKSSLKKIEETKKEIPKTGIATCTLYVEEGENELGKRKSNRKPCTRIAAAEKGGRALSRNELEDAGDRLVLEIAFESAVTKTDDVELELAPEYITIKAQGHQDLSIYLPYPVDPDSARVVLDRSRNVLELNAAINKQWDLVSPDTGSAPWLLAQALRGHEDKEPRGKEEEKTKDFEKNSSKPKSLAEMFHLEAQKKSNPSLQDLLSDPVATQWNPVEEAEELPEDRFHRKDMMSMHILEQRKAEREQKAREAEVKRKTKRADVEAKQKVVKEAGKTWREMYPDEPETTYIDVEDMIKKATSNRKDDDEEVHALDYVPTEIAMKAAAAWSENKPIGLDLKSALAFELLD